MSDPAANELEPPGTVTRSNASVCGAATDPCMNEDNWNQCQSILEKGCENVLMLESCPLQFDCNDIPLSADVCGEESNPCVEKKDWDECQDMIQDGCKDIMSTKSCPLKFKCLDHLDKDPISSAIDNGKSICGEKTDPCVNKESWNECQTLLKKGCDNIKVLESCPLQYFCHDESVNDPEEKSLSNVTVGAILGISILTLFLVFSAVKVRAMLRRKNQAALKENTVTETNSKKTFEKKGAQYIQVPYV